MAQVLRVKGWEDFQHYRTRRPPWIKLHKSLLDDYDFHCLPVESRALAPMLWLLVSECDGGRMPWRPEQVAFRLRTTVAQITTALSPLVEAGFFRLDNELEQGASNVLAGRKQSARLEEAERETETERETEREADARARAASADRHTPAMRCVVACNTGLRANPSIGEQFNELLTSNEAATVAEWLAAGVDPSLAERVVYERSQSYHPKPRNPQPHSLRYFTRAVLAAHEQAQQATAGVKPITPVGKRLPRLTPDLEATA